MGLFEGNFILQVPKSQAKGIIIGARVLPETLDEIDLRSVDSALTIGPRVSYFLDHEYHPANHDYSLGTFPPFDKDARYARSVIGEDAEGNLHMMVFNAAPRSTNFKGVTPREVANVISPKNFKWAYFLDGGQSSRLAYKDSGGKIKAHGNEQYVRLTALAKVALASGSSLTTDEKYLWSSRGRPIPSAVLITNQTDGSKL